MTLKLSTTYVIWTRVRQTTLLGLLIHKNESTTDPNTLERKTARDSPKVVFYIQLEPISILCLLLGPSTTIIDLRLVLRHAFARVLVFCRVVSLNFDSLLLNWKRFCSTDRICLSSQRLSSYSYVGFNSYETVGVFC